MLKDNSAVSTNVARIIFVVIIIAAAAWYYMSLPKPPASDFKLTGSFGFDLETVDPAGPLVKEARVESLGGFSAPVTLSLSEIPSGWTAEFDKTTVTPPPNGVAVVTISWYAESYAESADLILTAKSGDIEHTQTLTIRIVDWIED